MSLALPSLGILKEFITCNFSYAPSDAVLPCQRRVLFRICRVSTDYILVK